MTLNALLGIAGNALAAQSYALDVVGNNTSNVNTPGYVEEQVNLQDLPSNHGLFGGVVAPGVVRTVSQYTQAQVYASNGQASSASSEDSQLASVQTLFNDLSGTGLSSSLSALFTAFGTLATNPSDATSRNGVLSAAQQFAQAVSSTASGLTTQQQAIVGQAQGLASKIDAYATQIAKLNGEIASAKAEGQDASDMQDAQDAAVGSLSKLINIDTFTDGSGNLVVRAAGTTLVEADSAQQLSVQTASDGTFTLLDGGGGDLTSQLSGGELGGMLNGTDDIKTILTSLDQFTSDVCGAVNTQQTAGFDATGAPGTALFNYSASPGTALSVTVNPTVAGNASLVAASGNATDPNDGSNAATMAGLQDQLIATGGTQTAANAYASIVGAVGQLKSNSAQAVTTTSAVQSQSQSLLDSQSGVSLDQEMVNMQTYQSAYQAASKLLTTVTTLLNELMTNVTP